MNLVFYVEEYIFGKDLLETIECLILEQLICERMHFLTVIRKKQTSRKK